jgi:hypothetical protein
MIIDLQTNEVISRIVANNSLIIGDIDPFTNLIPCDCFDESEKQKRTLEEILDNIGHMG